MPLGESQVVIPGPAPSPSPAPSFPQCVPPVKSCPKITYADKVTDISMVQGFRPEDKDSLHNMGIPVAYAVHCSGTSGQGEIFVYVPLW